jgi:hypothetical protein
VLLPSRDYASAERDLIACGEIPDMERQLREFAAAGKFEETVVAIAAIAKLPIVVVDRLLTADSAEGLLVLGRAADLDWTTISAILTLRNGSSGFDPDRAYRRFSKLSSGVAEQIIQFWRDKQEPVCLSA